MSVGTRRISVGGQTEQSTDVNESEGCYRWLWQSCHRPHKLALAHRPSPPWRHSCPHRVSQSPTGYPRTSHLDSGGADCPKGAASPSYVHCQPKRGMSYEEV